MRKTISWERASKAANKTWKQAIKKGFKKENPYYKKQGKLLDAYIKILEGLEVFLKEAQK